jgi:hypothetical protein
VSENVLYEYWYDLWDDYEGQLAYINTILNPFELKIYKDCFFHGLDQEKLSPDEPVDNFNLFLNYLNMNDIPYHIINRPDEGISLTEEFGVNGG